MKKPYFLLIILALVLLSAIILRVIGVGNDKQTTKNSQDKKTALVQKNNSIVQSGDSNAGSDHGTPISATSSIVNDKGASFSSEAIVISPKQNEVITSPLKIQGTVVGSWFFEASMPIKLVDSENKLIASGVAKPDADPLTEKPIPFSANLDFSTTATSGYLIISNDNPSGLPEYSKSISLPVKFK